MVKLKLALLQLNSGANMAMNIARVEGLTVKAVAKGAKFVALPENAFFMGAQDAKRVFYTQENHPGVLASAAMAKKYGVWLLAGSVAVLPNFSISSGEVRGGAQQPKSSQVSHPPTLPLVGRAKTYNRSLLFDPQGKIAASYDKVHLFDVTLPNGEVYAESDRFLAGNKLMVVEMGSGGVAGKKSAPSRHNPITPLPKLGMTVCYDLRFPHLFRALAKKGAEIIAVPSAFTQTTGEAHWHVLLRARAIENGCFIIAPAQTGTHPGGRKTYGHSLIVDPWGKVLADGGTKEGVVMADIDLDQVKKTRASLPSLKHDREFK